MLKKFLSLLFTMLVIFVAVSFAQNNSTQNPTSFNYIPIVAALFGAGITQLGNFLFHKYKERQQKILLNVESTSIFKPFTITDKQKAVLNITSKAGDSHQFHNLFLSSIHLQNKSNKDFEDFEFIISAPVGYDIIQIAEQTPGDHHILSKSPDLDFNTRGTKVNIKLSPFNRGDKYSLKIYTTAFAETDDIPLLAFDTRFPVKFITEVMNSELEKNTISVSINWLAIAVMAVATLLGFGISSTIKQNQIRQAEYKAIEKILVDTIQTHK